MAILDRIIEVVLGRLVADLRPARQQSLPPNLTNKDKPTTQLIIPVQFVCTGARRLRA